MEPASGVEAKASTSDEVAKGRRDALGDRVYGLFCKACQWPDGLFSHEVGAFFKGKVFDLFDCANKYFCDKADKADKADEVDEVESLPVEVKEYFAAERRLRIINFVATNSLVFERSEIEVASIEWLRVNLEQLCQEEAGVLQGIIATVPVEIPKCSEPVTAAEIEAMSLLLKEIEEEEDGLEKVLNKAVEEKKITVYDSEKLLIILKALLIEKKLESLSKLVDLLVKLLNLKEADDKDFVVGTQELAKINLLKEVPVIHDRFSVDPEVFVDLLKDFSQILKQEVEKRILEKKKSTDI